MKRPQKITATWLWKSSFLSNEIATFKSLLSLHAPNSIFSFPLLGLLWFGSSGSGGKIPICPLQGLQTSQQPPSNPPIQGCPNGCHGPGPPAQQGSIWVQQAPGEATQGANDPPYQRVAASAWVVLPFREKKHREPTNGPTKDGEPAPKQVGKRITHHFGGLVKCSRVALSQSSR